jgi:hypothetical protein
MIDEELLSMKQLAAKMRRSYSYVKAMRRNGFRVIAGRTTLTAAFAWLAKNPPPCRVKTNADHR